MDKLHKTAKDIITLITSDFDMNIRVRHSHENSADYERSIIRLNLRDDEDFGFMRNLREQHNCHLDCISPMMWTILHEIGHFMTIDEIPEADYEEALETKALLAIYGDKIKTNTILQDVYFSTETEWQATEWAISYTRKHYVMVLEFSKCLEALR